MGLFGLSNFSDYATNAEFSTITENLLYMRLMFLFLRVEVLFRYLSFISQFPILSLSVFNYSGRLS